MNISGEQIRENPFRYWGIYSDGSETVLVRTVAIATAASRAVNRRWSISSPISSTPPARGNMAGIMSFHTSAAMRSHCSIRTTIKSRSGHAGYTDFAVKYANKVAFIDTDFVSYPGVLPEVRRGVSIRSVPALIDEYRFDLVILLENNTPWVADGLRSLGSSVDRKEFQSLLVSLLKENEIEFVHVKESDYDARFLRCVELVKQLMGEQG